MVGARRLKNTLLFLKEIRVEHTLFALPFAYTGAIFAARGIPSWHALLWITLAVLGARTAAMAANRYFDRDIDGRNPRTQRRALANKTLAPGVMVAAIAAGILLLIVSAWELNPLCVKLLPIAALGVLAYPLCKRFTWLTHFVLGAVDGLAPLGAYIAIAGTVSFPAVLLFVAVTLWVAGFDIYYALMDFAVDREQGIRSLPAAFGEPLGRAIPTTLHLLMFMCLLLAGAAAHTGRGALAYEAGLLAAWALIAGELLIVRRSQNVFVLNERIFRANMAFSVVFLVTTAWSFSLSRG
ncbi:MAG: UbiA-like polyprenyltransferase [Candidatus Baltobacteraceae bacterium]